MDYKVSHMFYMDSFLSSPPTHSLIYYRMCVREKEKERQREKDREREREKDRETGS
jgi:hypothetical protein